jgi:putative protease
LEAAIELRPDSVTLDYLELYGLRQSVDRLLENQLVPRVASPRVLKPSEQKVVRFLLSLDVAILVRSGGLLFDLLKVAPADRPPLFGDFSLNVANRLSAEAMLEMGLERLNPTHDLNAAQVIELAREISPRFMEVTVLQHLPIFHMEHCVFCRFLSTGTDNTNCGHPCEKHRLAVRDGSGRSHPVMADVGCRNTVFNAELQSAARHLDGFLTAGINDLRLEFVHQSEGEVVDCVTALRGFLDHKVTAEELDRLWNRATPCGTTEGSLFVPKTLVQLKG